MSDNSMLFFVVAFFTLENITIMFMMYRRMLKPESTSTRRTPNLKE